MSEQIRMKGESTMEAAVRILSELDVMMGHIDKDLRLMEAIRHEAIRARENLREQIDSRRKK